MYSVLKLNLVLIIQKLAHKKRINLLLLLLLVHQFLFIKVIHTAYGSSTCLLEKNNQPWGPDIIYI